MPKFVERNRRLDIPARLTSSPALPVCNIDYSGAISRSDQCRLVPRHKFAPQIKSLRAIVCCRDLVADDVIQLRLYAVVILAGLACDR